jgi:hypothetical protein
MKRHDGRWTLDTANLQPGLQRISEHELTRLICEQVNAARARGIDQVRDVKAFTAHLLDVAVRAERVARAVRAVLPAEEAPDPTVAFAAGAWHDGGKIQHGDDYHEINSALDILEHGGAWQLMSGPHDDVSRVLARAARAILSGFALYEQWQPGYVPTWTPRHQVEPVYARLAATLAPSLDGRERDRALLLPNDAEALVVMYSDLCNVAPDGRIPTDFDSVFEERWLGVERRAQRDDSGLSSVLAAARPRLRAGCALVHGWLTAGYDASALARFRSAYCT